VHGQATRLGTSTCVRAGPRWFAGRAELTGWPHGAARGSERVEETVHRAHETGPRGRDRRGARGRAGDRRRQPGPTRQREGERERERAGERNRR
jgi:hypothetical protein